MASIATAALLSDLQISRQIENRLSSQDQGLGRDRVLAEDNAGSIVSIPNVEFHPGLLAPA